MQVLTIEDAHRLGFRLIQIIHDADPRTLVKRTTWLLGQEEELLQIKKTGDKIINERWSRAYE